MKYAEGLWQGVGIAFIIMAVGHFVRGCTFDVACKDFAKTPQEYRACMVGVEK